MAERYRDVQWTIRKDERRGASGARVLFAVDGTRWKARPRHGQPQPSQPVHTVNEHHQYTSTPVHARAFTHLQRREPSPKHRGSCAGTNSHCEPRVSFVSGADTRFCCTHNVLRPARRGCVAHEPPRTTLCFPSKKSAALVSLCSLRHRPGAYLYSPDTVTLARSRHASPEQYWSTPTPHPGPTVHRASRPFRQQRPDASV